MQRMKAVWILGVLAVALAALAGCQDTRFVGVKPQVDIFTQTGDDVVDRFTQSGTQKVDTFTQTGFHQVDAFKQKGGAKVDILWIVDNSPSTTPDQKNLANNFDAFIATIDQSQIDYHIGVITTDMDAGSQQGRLQGNPKVINRNANAKAQFAANVQVGTAGSGNEQGLLAASKAVSEPLRSTDNAGFLRDDASLAVIFVSDEDDKSPGGSGFYVRFFSELKSPGNEKDVIVGAIVGDEGGCKACGPCTNDSVCLTGQHCANGYCQVSEVSDGKRYRDLVQNMGGTIGSICDCDFGPTLSQLGLTVAGLSHKFVLTKQPDPSTVLVRVKPQGAANFTQIPEVDPNTHQSNWRLKVDEPAIYFDTPGGYVPPPEADIEVEYGNVENQFKLSGRGDPTTIVVTVNGQPTQVNTDWVYDSGSNSIVFIPGHEPPLDSTVEISYSDLVHAFALSKPVVNDLTLKVEIDLKAGAGWQSVIKDDATGWMYDPRSNSILFQGSYVPPLGADLRVTYSNLVWLFTLSMPPQVDKIQVMLDPDGSGPLDSAFVPENDDVKGIKGWIYYSPDAPTPYSNAISFEKTTWPPLGSVLTVTYMPGTGT